MGITEKYARSTQSSNLRDNDINHNCEPLRAVALSEGANIHKIGHLLMRVKYANDHTSYNALMEKWVAIVEKKATSRKWPKNIVATKVANISLVHFLNDGCQICTGKRDDSAQSDGLTHLPLPGTWVLSDEACPACDGTGKKALQCPQNYSECVEDMLDALAGIEKDAAGNAMRRLAAEMDEAIVNGS